VQGLKEFRHRKEESDFQYRCFEEIYNDGGCVVEAEGCVREQKLSDDRQLDICLQRTQQVLQEILANTTNTKSLQGKKPNSRRTVQTDPGGFPGI